MSLTELLTSSFLIGAAGSLHCLGMCGPLALSLPLPGRTMGARLKGGLLYNGGRITTYALLGLVLGTVGEVLLRPEWQRGLSISAGALLLLYLFGGQKRLEGAGAQAKPFLRLRSLLSGLFQKHNYASVYSIGLLNGLLPCGTVYLALLTSFLTGGALKGGLFMAVFGMGTLPAMLLMVLWGAALGSSMRMRFRKAAPVVLGIMGVLLVLRGMNLGIPFVSPHMVAGVEGAVGCH
ncbi:sulfite exporter TauE/SafE family protein [Flaviaesturariibacter aridisoli]|uniref:Sulfite exporter TauE/SafE family protein n=1 Tax=Flaviaesturariibacter aridisoli TaxID=2545761 RepID=A0A4R4E5V5_9BACT|nr:sulfite exporter TauE/SafE family protein [Flaviaesturariibacter aridisoli]TCZ74859.1 sulfite exporter TauE/SafE family protein [Flaviaesturariibacter aridisoli]